MKIITRPYRPEDAEEFYNAVIESVPHVSKWLPWCSDAYSMDDAKLWTSSAKDAWDNGTDYRFVIESAANSMILGSVGINHIIEEHKVGSLGYWVRASALNKGVCTSAAKQVIAYAFKELALKRIEIQVLEDNIESNAVASKLGGTFECVARNKLTHNGHSANAKCYSVIPSDYEI